MFRSSNKEKIAIEISYDQKPTRPDEKERILKNGGKIEKIMHEGLPVGPYRTWVDDEGPGIAITRSLGDLLAKKIGLISDPEVHHIELQKGDKFIILGSDGLFDVMNSAEVCGFVNTYENKENSAEVISILSFIPIIFILFKALVNEARFRWDELNKVKKNNSKIGDAPYLRFGCDDITAVVCYL